SFGEPMAANSTNVLRTRRSRSGFLLLAATLLVPSAMHAQSTPAIRIVPVRGNIYLLSGAGANIVLSVGPQGVLLVDTGAEATSPRVLKAVHELNQSISTGGKPPTGGADPVLSIGYVLNTSARADHVGGNATIAADGRPGVNLS